MPTFGGAGVVEHPANPWPGVESTIDLTIGSPVGDGVMWDAFPLTFDVTEGAFEHAGTTSQTLRDIVQGNEWRLRRIVGKAHISSWHGALGSAYPSIIDCALGFIVSNCNDDGSPQTNFDEVNPLSIDSMEDPWIWRRRWVLNPWPDTDVNTSSSQLRWDHRDYPGSNSRYGSVADGPHIDAKTARVIHRSERLFAVLAARRIGAFGNEDPPLPGYADTGINMLLDYRLVGSLKGSTYGNRGNASR